VIEKFIIYYTIYFFEKFFSQFDFTCIYFLYNKKLTWGYYTPTTSLLPRFRLGIAAGKMDQRAADEQRWA
jgi:hypothetical protein